MRELIGYTTIGRLRNYWGHDPEDWGLLGPVGWSDDEDIRVRRTAIGAPTVQFERQADDGDWYVCIDTPYDHDLDDVPPELLHGGEAELTRLIRAGLSPAEALDFYMVEEGPHTQTSWAKLRGIGQGVVSENISKAKKELDSN